MKFQVKGGESELLGIDLKKVSLKRKIQNDDSTTKVSVRSGELKRTVPNKRGSDSDDPSPKKTPRAIHEKSKAIYKTALNGLIFLIYTFSIITVLIFIYNFFCNY